MAQRLSRFNRRAPRYRLEIDDIRFLRVVRKTGYGRLDFESEIVNVSESGIAFRLSISKTPRIGEILMMEFNAPGNRKIAWNGRVVRIELPLDQGLWKTFSQSVVVGVEFHMLPEAFRKELREGLQVKFRQIERERQRERFHQFLQTIRANWKFVMFYTLSAAVTFFILWALTRPSSNYDAARPSVWGERWRF